MDEILIDEKKYVSSKQAAKMTGYAKDYIGQLCREGRVPARLVGRSWYVLESAIQDHRFGDPKHEEKPKISSKEPAPVLDWRNQSPRYEATPVEVIPTIHRSENVEVEVPEHTVQENGPENLQSSWKKWFDRVGDTITSSVASEPESEEEMPEISDDDTEVNIPIHSIYRMPPKEILPHYEAKEEVKEIMYNPREEEPPMKERKGSPRSVVVIIKVIAVVLALAAGSVAALGSGYFNGFSVSSIQLQSISGIKVYNK